MLFTIFHVPGWVYLTLPLINNTCIFHFAFSCTSYELMPRSQEGTDQEQPMSQEKYTVPKYQKRGTISIFMPSRMNGVVKSMHFK